MARRADPAKLYIAHRVGLIGRLQAEGRMSEHRAEEFVAAWEAEAERRNLDRRLGDFWAPAWGWIAERRQTR